MAATKKAAVEEFDLPTILSDARTFSGNGRIVDKSIANWLGDCAEMTPNMIGRVMKKHVLGLTPEEAGKKVQAAFASLDEATIGKFFQKCAEARIERHNAAVTVPA